MRFCSLGSGSTGNATLVEAGAGPRPTRLLIDCGFTHKELALRLARIGLDCADIDAIFVTHEHGDHVGCALTVARRHRLPLWTSRGTWRSLAEPCLEDDPLLADGLLRFRARRRELRGAGPAAAALHGAARCRRAAAARARRRRRTARRADRRRLRHAAHAARAADLRRAAAGVQPRPRPARDLRAIRRR
jgi:glyoxylase-like metal-dependent hydrolase (beta-lactamase superfamily II)